MLRYQVSICHAHLTILYIQVCDHLKDAAKFLGIHVVPIVGGLSMEKQERLLKKKPEIVVGTPGRLWELMSMNNQHLVEVSTSKCMDFLSMHASNSNMTYNGVFSLFCSIRCIYSWRFWSPLLDMNFFDHWLQIFIFFLHKQQTNSHMLFSV